MAAENRTLQQLNTDREFWEIYEKGETIGRGHFAKVKLVRKRASGEFYAAKILDKRLEEHQEDYDSMMREFKVLGALEHPNIVHLHEAFETETSLILVCQLATGGELMHRIAEENAVYTEREVKRHVTTILEAVGFMHEQGVVHRDLKPENILLSNKDADATILIADFGLGRFVNSANQKMETVCGTHHYLAPELVKCDRGDIDSYGKAVDVWGIGLIAFIMLFGYNPFLRDSNMATHEAIVTCKYNFPKDDNVCKAAKDLIKKMICLSPEKRISIEDALKHPWLAEESSDANLAVGQNGVRNVMKEFNARRAVLKLTGMRQRGRRGSEDYGAGPTMQSVDTGKKPSPGKAKLSRRRSSNTEGLAQAIQNAEIGQ